jgi:group II intron reverse transcriptase/maturase
LIREEYLEMQSMQPTTEILEKVRQNSARNRNEIFTRLYRYLLRPDMYYLAYKNLYANNGAATKGVDGDTADGFSEEKISNIIKSLEDESYSPKPARRTYIRKANGKMRPLGIPTFTDKLVQEVLRMILEAVYEPVFLDCSHGFRPRKSCHTALKSLKNSFNGMRWFVEGDIKGCFDNIDHSTLVGIIGSKIKDARFIKLIYKFLKAGYMEDWRYNKTYSGTPQGGIVSPLFANIYLHELDKSVTQMAKDFDKPRERLLTDEYALLERELRNIRQRLKNAQGEKRAELVSLIKPLRKKLLKTPSRSQTDRKIRYIRYADDFIVGVKGSKEDCQRIKQQLSEYISRNLKMELSEEKTLITHSNTYARFLGYDIRVRRNSTIKQGGNGGTRLCAKRTLNNNTELCVPFNDKIMKFLFEKGIVGQVNGEIRPIHRKSLLPVTELEAVSTFNAELRGICNYYNMASNFYKLNFFAYLMEYSCLKTLAAKHKCSIARVKERYKDGKGKWSIPYETKTGWRRLYFAKYTDSKREKNPSDTRANDAIVHAHSITTFESRLKAKQCELCGTTESGRYEIHHVNKVKNLSGKRPWERVMIAKRRKTIVVCEKCHHIIHYQ